MTPDNHTNNEVFLPVGGGHKLYLQDWGNQDAPTPILSLHGGPGSGTSNRHKQRFAPEQQRVIFFDQRGAGQSTPKGSLKNNTTQDLVEDINKIAKHFRLEKFIITGSSWGSCLALAYALSYPQRVSSMVIGGVFTGSKTEIEFLDKGKFQPFFPDVWEQALASTPQAHHDNLVQYHSKRALGSNKPESVESAYVLSRLEGAVCSLDDRYQPPELAEFDADPTIIEQHYLTNGCFMSDKHILKNAHKLKMPVWLVQGRYDMVCPPTTAYELSKKLPNGRLIWTTAGHGNDRPNYDVTKTILLQLTC